MTQGRYLPTFVAVGTLAIGVLASAATAQEASDSTTGTVQVSDEVRSVTVSPEAFEFAECKREDGSAVEGLTFPNGECRYPNGLTVTNGEVPAHVYVTASDFLASDDVGVWTLTGETPGENEVRLTRFTTEGAGSNTSPTTFCDVLWNLDADGEDRCLVSPGQSMTQIPSIEGPSASTNTSPSWSTHITWIAMP